MYFMLWTAHNVQSHTLRKSCASQAAVCVVCALFFDCIMVSWLFQENRSSKACSNRRTHTWLTECVCVCECVCVEKLPQCLTHPQPPLPQSELRLDKHRKREAAFMKSSVAVVHEHSCLHSMHILVFV